jgi:hypothetical protein
VKRSAAHGNRDLVITNMVRIFVQIHSDIAYSVSQRTQAGLGQGLYRAYMKFVPALQPIEEYVKMGHIQTLINVDQKTKAIPHKESPFCGLLVGVMPSYS